MANQEQLDLLKQGTEVWNTWRKKMDEKTRITAEQIEQAKPGTHA